jgi:hypothetical protein
MAGLRAGNALRMRKSDRSMNFAVFFLKKKAMRIDANFFAFSHRIRIFASHQNFRVFAFSHRMKKYLLDRVF